MHQKWLILTKIDDKMLRIYYGYPSMYMVTYSIQLNWPVLWKRLAILKKDKDRKFPIFYFGTIAIV